MNKQNEVKLLVVIKNIDGGTGTYLEQLLRIQKYWGQTKFIIRTIVIEPPSFRKIRNKNISYLHAKNYYPQKYALSWKNINAFITEVFQIRNKIRHYRPDIVLGVDIHCNLLILLSLLIWKGKKPKTVVTTHINLSVNIDKRASFPLPYLLKFIVKILYSKADRLVGVSRQVSRDIENAYGIKKNLIHTIYNGIAVESRKARLGIKNNRFIMIGRHVNQKDFTTLLFAFRKVLDKIHSAQLVLLSDGPQREGLQQMIIDLNLQNNVQLRGWVDSIYPSLAESDIFVFSSLREGFGYVLIEAMSQGLPVISTDTPYGPAEILENGTYGILVPMQDPDSMSTAMITLLNDQKQYRYFSKKSITRVKYFSEEKMLKNYCDLFFEINR